MYSGWAFANVGTKSLTILPDYNSVYGSFQPYFNFVPNTSLILIDINTNYISSEQTIETIDGEATRYIIVMRLAEMEFQISYRPATKDSDQT